MSKLNYTYKKYPETVMAYLAGIMDGEGCFFIGNYSSNKKTGLPHYQTCIQVSNTDKPLIDWLYEQFGGERYTYTPKQTPKNARSQVYAWKANGERLEHLCELMLPYLVTKKQQAEIMMKMRATFPRSGKRRPIRNGIPPEILEIRLSCFNQLRALHSRNYANKK